MEQLTAGVTTVYTVFPIFLLISYSKGVKVKCQSFYIYFELVLGFLSKYTLKHFSQYKNMKTFLKVFENQIKETVNIFLLVRPTL